MADRSNSTPIPNSHLTEDIRHDPSEPLKSLDEHMIIACRLSRAMWLALDGKHDHDLDERDRQALYELASEIAHHSSAVLHIHENRHSNH